MIMDKSYFETAFLTRAKLLAVASLFALSMCFIPRAALARGAVSADVVATVSYDGASTGAPSSRSWYGDTLNLLNTQCFHDRYFDGNNVGIEMTASCPIDGTFTVSLLRVTNGRAAFVGSASFKRNGFTKATWEGVGSGTYRFVCKKPSDGKRVTSSDVAIYSW